MRLHKIVWNQRRERASQEGYLWRRVWPKRPGGLWRSTKTWHYPSLRNVRRHSVGLVKLCIFHIHIGMIHWIVKGEVLRVIITISLGLGRNWRVKYFLWQTFTRIERKLRVEVLGWHYKIVPMFKILSSPILSRWGPIDVGIIPYNRTSVSYFRGKKA